MILHYKVYAAAPDSPGKPLLILHGLYGQQNNWAAHARFFAASGYTVYVLDARNHGQSAHTDSMSLQEMAEDVSHTMDALGLAQAHLLGHSMGGKIAMLLALRKPQRVSSLVVVDIAPVSYQKTDDQVLKGLLSIDLASLQARTQADTLLAAFVSSKAVRDFLLTNLQRNADGVFTWRFNLPVLGRYFDELTSWPLSKQQFKGPVLVIKGADSAYVLPAYEALILAAFPAARIETVTGAGHWVHSEKPEIFQQLVLGFFAMEHKAAES